MICFVISPSLSYLYTYFFLRFFFACFLQNLHYYDFSSSFVHLLVILFSRSAKIIIVVVVVVVVIVVIVIILIIQSSLVAPTVPNLWID